MLAKRIKELEKKHGGLRAAARVLNVDPGYLSKLRDGKKDNPSDSLLKKLKLRRIVTVKYANINPTPAGSVRCE